jgi:hypothetical protein
MTDKLAKITIGGKAIPEFCPKCNGEGSLVFSTHLKWSVQAKWQHVIECQLCTYEEDVK